MNDRTPYLPRLIDETIIEKLGYMGAICIEGPKWCGKTRTALHHSRSMFSVDDPSNSYQNRKLAMMDPDLVLSGEIPRTIDEWQEVPSLWDAVRSNVDRRNPEKGLFIMTGSATPNDGDIIHSGVGRISTIKMRTMSLFESRDSTGAITIRSMFDGSFKNVMIGDVRLEHLVFLTARGGWPGSLGLSEAEALKIAPDYIDGVVRNDLKKLNDKSRDEIKFQMLLRSLARNESTVVSKKTILSDIQEYEGYGIGTSTLDAYLNDLQRLHLTDNCEPFNPRLRAKDRIGKSVKRHFVDPSLAIAALGVTPSMLMNDLETYGFMFEAMCNRDLKIYADALGGRLYHYRDKEGYELDAVLILNDGRWGAFEIKLGFYQVDDGADNLNKVCDYIGSNSRVGPPVFKCVICGMSSAAFRRDDDVYVVPITALRN
ncbi:ATP-binding protein [Candidatus Methanoprimaticola sp. MG2]|uniref:ATP-binding protein n=1 Tax=Candidatus Methanoprimaticola sp. MG2 TaxID=3228838 RepID=UPI0039C729D2